MKPQNVYIIHFNNKNSDQNTKKVRVFKFLKPILEEINSFI